MNIKQETINNAVKSMQWHAKEGTFHERKEANIDLNLHNSNKLKESEYCLWACWYEPELMTN